MVTNNCRQNSKTKRDTHILMGTAPLETQRDQQKMERKIKKQQSIPQRGDRRPTWQGEEKNYRFNLLLLKGPCEGGRYETSSKQAPTTYNTEGGF